MDGESKNTVEATLKKEIKKKDGSIFWDKFLTKDKPCCTIKAKYHR